MYKKIFSLKLVLIIALSSFGVLTMTGSSFGKLKDFKGDVERNENSKSGKSSGGGSSDSDSDGSCAGACMEMALEITFAIWAAHNMLVYYEEYPYFSKNKNFINYYKPHSSMLKNDAEDQRDMHMVAADDADTSSQQKEDKDDFNPFKNKFYYYSIAAGGQWANDEGSGFQVEFRGKFIQHFGPEFSARSLWDGEDDIQFYSGGLNLSLFQNSYLSADFYITGAFMRGVIERDGVGFGAIITSFPFKPVTLFVKIGGIDFGKTEFLEFEGRIGFMIGRVELFAGYQMIHHPDILDIGGPIGGARVFM